MSPSFSIIWAQQHESHYWKIVTLIRKFTKASAIVSCLVAILGPYVPMRK